MPERQDFLQRLLDELRLALVQVGQFRAAGSHDAALATLLHGQERLFVRPAPEFMLLPVDEQVRLLVIGETDDAAREKCSLFANFLTEMARTYEAKGQAATARGAYQLALHVLLVTAGRFPRTGADAELEAQIAALRRQVPADQINPALQPLLARHDATRGQASGASGHS